MLVITRKRKQQIKIGQAVITILGHGPGGVRLGIAAPKDVPIERDNMRKEGPDGSGNP